MFTTRAKQYAWKELTVLINGKPITGIQDIEYKIDKNLEDIYGTGDSPQHIGEGNKSYSGSLDLLQNEYEALTTEAKKQGGDDITDIEVDIYLNLIPKGTDAATSVMKAVVKKIIGVKFSSAGLKFTQGNTYQKGTLPYKALYVDEQV